MTATSVNSARDTVSPVKYTRLMSMRASKGLTVRDNEFHGIAHGAASAGSDVPGAAAQREDLDGRCVIAWPAVSSIRDFVAVAKTRASVSLPDVCPDESATSWLPAS
jgi:hypothetical protein